MITDDDDKFREYAVANAWLTEEQLETCLGIQDRTVGRRMKRLGPIAVEEGMLTPEQLTDLYAGRTKPAPVHRIGGYEVKSVLGEGGLGTVYLAHQVSMDRDVALKVLRTKWLDDDEFRQRFLLEAQHVGKMSHQNLVQVFDAGLDGEQLYFSMEYVPGDNVQQMIDDRSQLELEPALDIAIQVVRAIDYYKDFDVVHRDIKPSNIFVSPAGIAKLGDFGFIKTEIDKEISMEGYILGTPDYISPEQAIGDDELDYRSDVYSLGATLYHMLTGQTPYLGSESSVIRQHIKIDVPSPLTYRDDLPDPLISILERMMAKEPADRYGDMSQLADDLEMVKSGRYSHVRRLEAGKSSILRDFDLTEKRLERLEDEREELREAVIRLERLTVNLTVALAIAVGVALAMTVVAFL